MSSFDPFKPRPKQASITIWTIAMGVCMGVISANAITFAVSYMWTRIELSRLSHSLEQSAAETKRMFEESYLEREAKERQRQAEAKAKDLADAAQAEAAALAAQRKQAAWERFYKRPPECDNNPNTETFTRCANEHLRARTQFEASYKP